MAAQFCPARARFHQAPQDPFPVPDGTAGFPHCRRLCGPWQLSRKGCEEKVLESICICGPEKVVYISCDVATQARDAKYLCARGYKAVRCQSVDMFCLTGHIENVLLFVKEME